jgi:hypothetical protein
LEAWEGFSPLRRASTAKRVVLFVLGPLAWVVATLNLPLGAGIEYLGFGLAWGVAIAAVATIQLLFALRIDLSNDRRAALAFLIGLLYPLAYWTISALAALRCETGALLRGPGERHVSCDLPRDRLEPQAPVSSRLSLAACGDPETRS